MLVNEAGAVVDLVVDDHEQVLLGVVLGDLLESEFLAVRHDGRCVIWRQAKRAN